VPRDIQIDRDLCMGSGQCTIYAPNTFDQDDEAIAIVVDADGDSPDALTSAVTGCPTHAISVAGGTGSGGTGSGGTGSGGTGLGGDD
jgi:ferredoxin